MTDAAVRATTHTNLTVLAGTAVKFGCETDNGSNIRWNFISPRLSIPLILFNGYRVHGIVASKVSVNTTETWNEITVRDVTADDSGEYSCHQIEDTSNEVIFHLRVEGTSFSRIISLTHNYNL